MYLMTVFEEGIRGDSAWSKVWQTREEFAIMEYIQDIRVSRKKTLFESSKTLTLFHDF